MDSLAIPANAKNVEGAHKLINFLLRPEIAAQVAESIGYPTPNLEAKNYYLLKLLMTHHFTQVKKFCKRRMAK